MVTVKTSIKKFLQLNLSAWFFYGLSLIYGVYLIYDIICKNYFFLSIDKKSVSFLISCTALRGSTLDWLSFCIFPSPVPDTKYCLTLS